jgi:C1A family cysteine protease
LKAALNHGSVSILVNADNLIFKNYFGGIIDHKNCSANTNHYVLAVGYGFDKETNKEFLIIKNTWGSFWGKKGYALIAMSQINS